MNTSEAAPAVTLTGEQEAVCGQIERWLADAVENGSVHQDDNQRALTGLAGTGKSTLAFEVRRRLRDRGLRLQYLAPTGKAAYVLRSKGIEDAKTIHSFLYDFQGLTTHEKTGKDVPVFSDKEDPRAQNDYEPDALAVDEASMVNTELYRDLVQVGLPILWVGDPGQLPPIGGDPKILEDPAFTLKQVHRQAWDSPVLRLAYHVRQGQSPRSFPAAEYAADPKKRLRLVSSPSPERCAEFSLENKFDAVLCGFNQTRHALNKAFRDRLGFTEPLHVGDRLVGLLNDRRRGVFNGSLYTVEEVKSSPDPTGAIEFTGRRDDGAVLDLKLWGPALARGPKAGEEVPSGVNIFDYGQALTVHKFQGSEAARIVVLDQQCKAWSPARWRYTAYTRAKETCVVAV